MTLTVVLTREPPRNDDLLAALDGHARTMEVPLTTTSLRASDEVARAVRAAPRPHWIVVTSTRAVAFVADARDAFPDAVVAAVGPVTAAALAAAGVPDVRQPSRAGAAAVADMIDTGPVLSLGAAETRPELASALATRGVALTHVACYDTVPATLDGFAQEEISLGDVIVIAAPSAWMLARSAVRRATIVVVTGDTTADAVRADHDHAHVIVATPGTLAQTLADLVVTLDDGGASPEPK